MTEPNHRDDPTQAEPEDTPAAADPIESVADADPELPDLDDADTPAATAPERAELERQASEWQDRYLRLAAEYDNFRKRTARERDESRGRAQGDLAQRLLDALDDLGRVAHLDAETTSAADVIAGVELVERKMLRELGSAGLEVLDATDVPFDPAVHEAVVTVPTDEPDRDHTVAGVLQIGYRFNGFLLRPARVQVRVYAPDAE